MGDQMIERKRSLAGWVWGKTRDMNYESVFCPFSGWPSIPMMFKEQGKGVITTDLLESNFHLARALVENDEMILDATDVDLLTEDNPDRVQLMEGVCNAYGIAPEHGAWLDNLRSNFHKLDEPYKQSMAMAAGIRVIRYLMSFESDTRCVMPDEDPSGSFHYYLEFMNRRVFSNGCDCEAHDKEAMHLAPNVNTDAMFFYVPSPWGVQSLSPERRMMELFVHFCTESNLDRILEDKAPSAVSAVDDVGEHAQNLNAFLTTAGSIPIWILGYNNSGSMDVADLESMLKQHRKNVMVLENPVIESSTDRYIEYLLIAHP